MARTVTCPMCGARGNTEDINCRSCGADLTEQAPQPPVVGVPQQPVEQPSPGEPSPARLAQLAAHIRRRQGEGADGQTIVQELLSEGWSEAEVRAGMARLSVGAPARRDTADSRATKMLQHVLERMEAGATREAVIMQLVDDGLTQDDATQLVDKAIAEARVEDYGPANIALGIAGGLVAAGISGVLWGMLVHATSGQFGIAAWGVGLLCGYAVRLLSQSRGMPFQVIAALSALLGMAVGKYTVFYLWIASGESGISPFSPDVLRLFFTSLPEAFSGFDVLWVLFAVGAAWGVPRARGLRRPRPAGSPPAPVG